MRSLVLVCVLLLVRAAAADPPGRLPFRSFGSEQGLENLSISQITQTADGLMWFATEDGLYSYDGARFQRFDTHDGLPSNGIYVLLPTAKGLWVGTAKGLVHLDQGRATNEGVSVVGQEGINALAIGPDGTLWVATDSGLFHQVGKELALADGWPGGSSNAVWVDKDGFVIASRGLGVATQDTAGRWTTREQTIGLGRARIRGIARTADRIVWLRSSQHTWECNQTVTTCTDVSLQLPDIGESSEMFVDRGGLLWAATRRGLAHRRGPGEWEILGSEQGLPARSVMTAFEDREGSMWIAAGELYQLLGRGLWRGYTASDGFPADSAWTVARDRAGGLWVGTNRGLLYSRGDAWETVSGTEPYNLRAVVDAGAVLYVAGTAPGVMVIDRATHTLTAVITDAVLGTDGIISMAYDQGTLWMATSNLGLVRMTEHAGRRTWRREEVPGGDAREHFHQLMFDRGGRLWAAGWHGLAVLDDGHWQRFTQADGLANTQVQYIVERRSGELCVAYAEPYGVTCFRRGASALEQLRHITKLVGLTSDKIYLLGEDQAARLYVGMGNGLDIISDETTVEHFSTATGLVGDDCAARAFWSDPGGDVMIGTTRGLARFSARRYEGPLRPIAPVVLQLALDDERQRLTDRLEAPGRGSADVAIRFATPVFANRTRLEQQIRLLPMEHDFRSTSGDEARYAQLPHGDYTFELRSRFATGEYGPVTRVAFSIRPAWWQTTLVRVLALLALLAILARLIAWRARVISRRGAARIIARSQASFHALIEESPDAVFVHRDGTLVYANARTSTYLGYSNAELTKMTLLALVSPEERTGFSPSSQKLMTTGRSPAVREVRMLRKDGSTIFVEISALEVDFAGSPAQLSIARDCTQRKALEARVMVSDRMASIGTLAAGIAHEINNPLAYLKANLETIADELEHAPASELLRGAVVDALDGATRVQNIVQGVKTFSRVEDEARQPIEIRRAVQVALRMTAAELRHCCRVVENYGPVPTVLGSESRLGQVFMNLLVNAAQAMPTGAMNANEIRISTSTDARGDAVIEIRDSGCGMSPDVLKRAFEPFFTTKGVGKGTGLGLAICHGIIHSLGGTIVAESTLTVGTTLRITLPAAPVAPARVPSTRVEVIASSRLRVLVIDDDVKLLASIGRILTKEHEVSLANSPAEAMALLEPGERFDVILCDLMMPELTGMDLYETLETLIPDQARQMLFMTGGTFTEQAAKFLERSSIRWLEKPFETAELRRRIQAIARA
jgi:PAS domain S-box-containing protein